MSEPVDVLKLLDRVTNAALSRSRPKDMMDASQLDEYYGQLRRVLLKTDITKGFDETHQKKRDDAPTIEEIVETLMDSSIALSQSDFEEHWDQAEKVDELIDRLDPNWREIHD